MVSTHDINSIVKQRTVPIKNSQLNIFACTDLISLLIPFDLFAATWPSSFPVFVDWYAFLAMASALATFYLSQFCKTC